MERLRRFIAGVLVGLAVGFTIYGTKTHAKSEPVRPDLRQEFPKKAIVKPDCKVILVRRSTPMLKMADGTVVPLAVVSAIRTRC